MDSCRPILWSLLEIIQVVWTLLRGGERAFLNQWVAFEIFHNTVIICRDKNKIYSEEFIYIF